MLVKIEQIRDAGLHVDEQMNLELLGAALEGSGFRATEPLKVSADFRKVSDGVLLKGSFTSRVVAECKRCLTEAKLELPVSFTINLVPESLVRGEDVLDEEVFDGKVIDLEPIVREQLLLALPMNAVCREDCSGLCTNCGQNLNEKQCGCDTKFVDPRLAVLKNIKL